MHRLSFIALCAACFALTFSVGCGGDDDSKPDGGSKPVPDAGQPDAGQPDAGRPDSGTPLDLTPPTVTAVSPAQDTENVPPEHFIEISFSEKMQTGRGVLQISPGTGLPNNGLVSARPQDWDVAAQKVTFGFPEGLPLKAKLTVSVSGFADLAGNPLSEPYTFSFTVSDGQPPRVASAHPVENASRVPLDTAEVTFTFTQPMDTTVGRLVAGGGLKLGPATWVGNQTLKAPIADPLVYNGIYSVRLEEFRNGNGKALDGTTYLGDGKLDFGTGDDLTIPTVTNSSPKEGDLQVLPEDTAYIVFIFSEPMDKTMGKAELVDGATRTTLAPIWSDDGFNVSYDVRMKLRHNTALRVVLTGFKDKSGNALNTSTYLGDGELDFTTLPDTIKPHVVSSDPPNSAQNVYPVEVYATGGSPATGYRKVFTIRFNEPMSTSVSQVTLHEDFNPNAYRTLNGSWSADRMTLTVTVLPASAGQLPLLADYPYYLELSTLKDAAGNPLDLEYPGTGNGKLRFKTIANFPLLNHACEHALTTTPVAVTSTGNVNASTPRTDQLHGRYEVTLQSNGTSYSGFTKVQLVGGRGHYVFTNRNILVAVTDPSDTNKVINVDQNAVSNACADITHAAYFQTTYNPELHVRFGPLTETKFRFVLEEFF